MLTKSLITSSVLAAMVMISAPAFAAPSLSGDTALAGKVRQSLGSYYGSEVSVRADGGRVFLSGKVGTDRDRKEAVSLAEKTPGVKIVHENLESLSGSEG